MRVIALLRELNISLESLKNYESLLVDTDFKYLSFFKQSSWLFSIQI